MAKLAASNDLRTEALTIPPGFRQLVTGGIKPTAEADLSLLRQARGASLTGTTLPSGATVPPAPKGHGWVVKRVHLELSQSNREE
jgi:hypothetical protein